MSHDTTYLVTTNVRTGRLAALRRTYYVGRGQRPWRHDELAYNDNGLSSATYSYQRLAKQRVLEVGQLTQSQRYRLEELAQLTHYAYLPSGLLVRTSTLDQRNELRVEQFYQYGYSFRTPLFTG